MTRPNLLPEFIRENLNLIDPPDNVWLVGGAVRDRLLAKETADFDFAVRDEARRLARQVADRLGGDYFVLDQARDTARVLLPWESGGRRTLDFAVLRGADIAADLASRDFTINAMAIPLRTPQRLLDPLGGLQDLKDSRLRACSSESLLDDPVRTFRAVRFSTELSLTIDPPTRSYIKAAAEQLGSVSIERLRDEFFAMLATARPAPALRLLDHFNLLGRLFPLESGALQQVSSSWGAQMDRVASLGRILGTLGPVHDPEGSAGMVLAEVSLRLGRFRSMLDDHLRSEIGFGRSVRTLLYFTALLSQGEPGSVGEAAARLQLSGGERSRAARIARASRQALSLEFEQDEADIALYRYYRAAGEGGVEGGLLALAGVLAESVTPPPQDEWVSAVEKVRRILSAFFETPERHVAPPVSVTGDDLMLALDLAPGPMVGKLIEHLREAAAAGEVEDRDQALERARRWVESNAESD